MIKRAEFEFDHQMSEEFADHFEEVVNDDPNFSVRRDGRTFTIYTVGTNVYRRASSFWSQWWK